MNDDLLLEIFDACRVDNISPNTYPQNWWYKLAHVCKRWRSVLFAFPIRLGITLVCNSRIPVADLLAGSPPLPIIVYWGNPETLDSKESVQNVHLALQHRDRVCRIKLYMPEESLRDVFASMEGTFPMLETLQLYCSSMKNSQGKLPSGFVAPNLRHLQLSDLTLLPPLQSSPLLNGVTTHPSIVSFYLGEITPDLSPKRLAEMLSLMPNLKNLKIGLLLTASAQQRQRVNQDQKAQQVSRSTLLADLEELQFKGNSEYFEGIAALISAPFLQRLSITFSNTFSNALVHTSNSTPTPASGPTAVFRFLPTLISEASNLRFHHARVRYRDGFSIVMDHNELWSGRGAFELKFDPVTSISDQEMELVGQVCGLLSPMPATVQSLLIEDAENDDSKFKIERQAWHDLLRLFDNVKTLRVARRFVDELDRALQPDAGDNNEGRWTKILTLLPRLQEIVRYGSENEFAAFVEARRMAGLPVRVVSGPKNRLALV
jgi:hypothetical protein